VPVGGEGSTLAGVPTPDEIEDAIVAALRRIIRAIDLQSRRMVDACGLTGPQFVVLREASRLRGASASALARAVSLSQPTVSGILERLAKRGLVERERSEQDRRSLFVRVTPDGERILSEAPSFLQDRFRRELERIEDWERTQMLSILQRVAGMMDAEEIDAAPILETGTIGDLAPEPDETDETGDDPTG